MATPEVVISNGLRWIAPYHTVRVPTLGRGGWEDAGPNCIHLASIFFFPIDGQRLRARAKGRWLGRTVLDVLLDEFKGFGGAYYTAALAAGRIRINGERIAADRVIANGDALSHDAHVHEAPVVDAPITVLGQSDDLVAVVKPASWPTHPTGASVLCWLCSLHVAHARGYWVFLHSQLPPSLHPPFLGVQAGTRTTR